MQLTFDFTPEETLIGVYVLCGFYVLLCTPLNLYFTLKIWKLHQQNEPFITKRRPKVVIASSIAFNFYAAVIRPIADYLRATGGNPFLIFSLIQLIQIVIVLICIRLWLLFFDYKRQIYALNYKWKVTITKCQKVTSWTHTHKWMGNAVIVSVLGVIFATVATVTMMYLLKECLIQTVWFLVVHIVYIAVIGPCIPMTSNIRILVTSLFSCTVSFTASWISTIWVVFQYQRMRNRQRQHYYRSTNQSPSINTKQLQLEQVLRKKSAFDVFAVHLVNEFSIENLAFVLEAMQIKMDLIDSRLCSENEVGLLVPMCTERMQRTRRTKRNTLYTVQDLRDNIQYLMHQYIERSAECGVNLSSMTRDRSLEIFHQLEHQQITTKRDGDGDGGDSKGDVVESPGSGVDHVVLHNLDFFVNGVSLERSRSERELSKQYALLLDKALEEIISLLRSDCLVRFQQSKAYMALRQDPSL